jgi:sulfatase maturation enzyme AslB (radical SAM superfamily)
MANLSITNVCNKRCVYCFANDTRIEFGKTYVDDETFEKALDYLERSGLRQARLLGGEPTLHPNFISFLNKALDRGLDIMLFTNGLISEKVMDFLTSLPEDRLSVLLNTIHPVENNPQGTKHQQKIMKRLGRVIIPGVNIYSAKQKLEYLLEYVARYDLKKEIRMGISHSVLSRNNVFMHPKEYHKIGLNIVKLKMEAKKAGVLLGFDCGFVPCMFPKEYFELLSEELKKAGTCCHPIIDMLTDGSFIACYPLNNLIKVRIHNELHAKELIKVFEEAILPYTNVGIYTYCTTCQLFNTRCNGGCMSYRIQRHTNSHSFHDQTTKKVEAL